MHSFYYKKPTLLNCNINDKTPLISYNIPCIIIIKTDYSILIRFSVFGASQLTALNKMEDLWKNLKKSQHQSVFWH